MDRTSERKPESTALTALTAAIARVTLMEDRARVHRAGSVFLEPGRHTLRIDGVAPVLADKTVSCTLASDAAELVDVRVRRQLVARDDKGQSTDGYAALEREAEELDARIAELEARQQFVTQQWKTLQQVLEQTIADLAVDSSFGSMVSSDWDRELDGLRSQSCQLLEERADLGKELLRVQATRDRLHQRLAGLDHVQRHATAHLEIDLMVHRAAEIPLTVDYVVPGACWRPYHSAELRDGDEPAVAFATDACVWQNTGESWQDVELCCSTERLSLGVEPPQLTTDLLQSQRRSEAVVVETREQEVETTGLGTGEGITRSRELPGIDDGGASWIVTATGRHTVPSDGRPHRVPLGGFTAKAQARFVTMPELSPCVILAVALENRSDTPILAGPVDLVRRSGLVGKTSILFVAPGERFEVGFGPESSLRVRREVQSSEEKGRLLSSWQVRQVDTVIRLSNLGGDSYVVQVKERVPISEIDKVRFQVDVKGTSEGKSPDENGFVEWTVVLGPRAHAKLKLCYESRKHEDVQGM